MTHPKICLFPDAILRKKAETVTRFDQNLAKTIQQMIKVMESQRHGIGIAAPQIGVSKRIAIVDVSPRVKGAQRYALINPEVVEYQDEILSREGCMSLPEYTADLKRYRWIRAKWQTEKGLWVQREVEGIEAICFQHEIDHLNGMLFIDRVSSLKTDMFPRLKHR